MRKFYSDDFDWNDVGYEDTDIEDYINNDTFNSDIMDFDGVVNDWDEDEELGPVYY